MIGWGGNKPEPARHACLLGAGLMMLSMALALVSCGPPAITGDFDSPQPAAEIFASRRAANQIQSAPEHIPSLIRLLESDDPAVRMVAIMALEKLTGTTMGYRYYDPSWLREQYVDRWVRAWEDDAIVLVDGTRVGRTATSQSKNKVGVGKASN